MRSYEVPDLRGVTNHLQFTMAHSKLAEIDGSTERYENRISWNRLFLVERGRGEVRFRRRSGGCWHALPLRPGCAAFMPAGLELRFTFPRGLRLFAIHFRLELLPGADLFRDRTRCESRPLTDRRHLRQLCDLARQDPSQFSDLLSARAALLAEIAPFLRGTSRQFRDDLRLYRLYQPVLDRLHSGPPAAITVKALADLMGWAPSTLSRKFHADTGFKLKGMLTRRVLDESTRLLAEEPAPIRVIARRLGFASDIYFARFIRKHTGHAPGAYRLIARQPLHVHGGWAGPHTRRIRKG